jgi:putative ABC transport system substrate-binding protein
VKLQAVVSFALIALLLTLCVPAEAQQPGRSYRIGYLSNAAGRDSLQDAFREKLRDLGYVEGQNVAIEWRLSKGNADLHPTLAADLARLNVDCIVAVGVGPVQAAKEATNRIPIVMGDADDDPVRHGLVASLARPGGNVTGVISISSDLAGKRLELLKETVPQASRVTVLRSPGSAAEGHFRETDAAARTLSVQIQPWVVRGPEDIENAFRAPGKSRPEAFIVVGTGLVNRHRELIIELAGKTRLPAMYTQSRYAFEGGLMSYAADIFELRRRAAIYVDKILKGAKPSDLPVEQPTKFELVINLKAAKQIGLTIPPNVLARAHQVIK